MGLPPTSSKISGDAQNITTFNYQFPNFTGTHTGVTVALAVNAVAGGGTGDATLTANNFLVGAGTSPVTFFAPGASGTVVSSNGTTFINTNFAGTAAFAIFASSQVTTEALSSSTSFVTASNSPAFTFTPTVSGTYKVYASIPAQNDTTAQQALYRIFNTSGGATLLQESQATSFPVATGTFINNLTAQSNYTLTAGVTYVFDIQYKSSSGGDVYIRGDEAPFYMFAEGIGLTSPAVATPHAIRYFSSTSTISSSLSTITYATQDYDADSAYSSGTYTVQASANGKYQVNASLLIAGTIALNNTLIMEIQKNGTVVSRRTKFLLASMTDADIQISDIINCVATDTLRIQVSTTATLPTIVSSNFDNYLSICKVSA